MDATAWGDIWAGIALVAGAVGAIVAIVVGISNYSRSSRKDAATASAENGTILAEIGYIKSGIDDIRRKQDKQDERNIEVITRLTAVEESAKQSHLRITRLENKPPGNTATGT